jgi:hypothetical protein
MIVYRNLVQLVLEDVLDPQQLLLTHARILCHIKHVDMSDSKFHVLVQGSDAHVESKQIGLWNKSRIR